VESSKRRGLSWRCREAGKIRKARGTNFTAINQQKVDVAQEGRKTHLRPLANSNANNERRWGGTGHKAKVRRDKGYLDAEGQRGASRKEGGAKRHRGGQWGR